MKLRKILLAMAIAAVAVISFSGCDLFVRYNLCFDNDCKFNGRNCYVSKLELYTATDNAYYDGSNSEIETGHKTTFYSLPKDNYYFGFYLKAYNPDSDGYNLYHIKSTSFVLDEDTTWSLYDNVNNERISDFSRSPIKIESMTLVQE